MSKEWKKRRNALASLMNKSSSMVHAMFRVRRTLSGRNYHTTACPDTRVVGMLWRAGARAAGGAWSVSGGRDVVLAGCHGAIHGPEGRRPGHAHPRLRHSATHQVIHRMHRRHQLPQGQGLLPHVFPLTSAPACSPVCRPAASRHGCSPGLWTTRPTGWPHRAASSAHRTHSYVHHCSDSPPFSHWLVTEPGRCLSPSTQVESGLPCHVNAPFFVCESLLPLFDLLETQGQLVTMPSGAFFGLRGPGVDVLNPYLQVRARHRRKRLLSVRVRSVWLDADPCLLFCRCARRVSGTRCCWRRCSRTCCR